MRIYSTEQTVEEKSVCALGNFDGLHLGHRALVNKAIELAKQKKLMSVTYIFDRHPNNVLSCKTMTAIITTVEQKKQRFEQMGLDCLYIDHFDESFANLSPEDFVKEVLVKKLNARICVCGFHYHFGAKGQGDTALLKKLCKQHAIEVVVIPPVTDNGVVVSSSNIRSLISCGDVDTAKRLMGGIPFSLESIVVPGKKLGRKMGFPTINMCFDDESVVPKYGVYATKVWIDDKWHMGATNVGYRPTVSGDNVNAETNIIGYSGDLYGKKVRVDFLKMIRHEKKFENIDKLKEQIAIDKQSIIRCFNEEAVEK